MLLAETAVLAHFDTVRIVALILHRVVIALLALRAGESDFDSHLSAPPNSFCLPRGVAHFCAQKENPLRGTNYYITPRQFRQEFFSQKNAIFLIYTLYINTYIIYKYST